MTPETFSYTLTDGPLRERILSQPERWNLLMAHVVLPPGEAIHAHATDSEVFLLVVRGTLHLALEGGEPGIHARGTVVHLPKGTLMEPRNDGAEVMEMFVLKTPHPDHA